MIKRLFAIWMFVVVLASGCVKETYDMEKLSHKAELSPTIVIPAFKGTALLSDAVKESDTVIYDSDKFVRLVFRKDSAINIGLQDYLNVNDLVTFSDTYTIGEIMISPFQGTMGFTLDEVSRNFSSALRNQFETLDDGSNHPFPSFPSVNAGSKTFSAFPNFQNAVFASGFLDISIKNNFNAPLSGVQINLSNSYGAFASVTLPAVNAGQTQTTSINLAGKTLTNTLTASVTLSGSPGNATPVLIDLDQSNISFTASGRDLKVSSGKVIVPSQTVSEEGSVDIVSFDPGNGIELERMRIISGTLSWEANYNATLNASVDITLPTAIRNGTKVTETINVNQMHSVGALALPNTSISFDVDPAHPYNKIPVEYTIRVNSNNLLVDFHSTDQVKLDLNVANAEFDYIKGYFGQQVENVEPDTLDFGIDEYIRNLSGDFFLTNPSIKINYSNSFAVPIQVNLNGKGLKGSSATDLGLAPILVAYPQAPAKDISSSFSVDKNNSALPQLVSMPPESVIFSGSAKMNPDGDPNHLRNNYVYGRSRFLASVEMELPLELSFNNLQLTDTTDNFLSGEDSGGDINTDDLDLARIGISFKNGFPFSITARMSLYNTSTKTVKSYIDVPELLKAAPLDANGKATGFSESAATIEVTKQFLDNIDSSDQVIFTFRIATPGAPRAVKIYSDYRLDFNVSMFLKTNVKIDL
ncbi:MAG: hypothetical protein ACM3UT_12295 [Chloroflexota bacterium]